jgi:hypothetical protein
MKYHLSFQSSNSKVGPVPVSTSSNATCPSSCPLKNNGCYASSGALRFHWDKVSKGLRGEDWKGFLAQIKTLAYGQFWRHNQAGDLPGVGNKIDTKKLAELVQANQGRKGYTYTHKPATKENAEAIKQANEKGFTINLSANSLAQADELKALNIGPVVAIISSEFKGHKGETPKGNRFIVCPAQLNDKTTCATCQLCQKQRGIIVGFLAHGNSKNRVNVIAKG